MHASGVKFTQQWKTFFKFCLIRFTLVGKEVEVVLAFVPNLPGQQNLAYQKIARGGASLWVC
jgi:hypothetical protein